jgi:ribosomal protein S18 acetylase RimI-like enzyme
MPEPTVRDAKSGDQQSIKEIIGLSFPLFYRYFAARSVKNLDEPLLVSEADGGAAGFTKLIEFTIAGVKYGCILWIAVHPKFRRRGIALQLTKASVECLKRRGAHAVLASTQKHNRGALGALAATGFERTRFKDLRGRFGWHVFGFYGNIWYAPGEVVLWRRMDF